MTPLLPAVSVGTIETRTVIESIRSLIGPRIQYIEAHCVNVDVKGKVITCNSTEENVISATDQSKSVIASSRVIKDSSMSARSCLQIFILFLNLIQLVLDLYLI